MTWRLNSKAAICIVYVATMFMVAMDTNVLNVSLRAIGNDMGIAPSAAGSINVGYLVSLAIMLTAAGWIGDRFGAKKIFLLAIITFTASSALCGLSSNLVSLYLFRIVQGASGGLLTPIAMKILFQTFPPEERMKLSRYLVLPVAIAPALGPIVGGYCVDYLSWRWVFYVNVPIGILAVLFAFLFLQEDQQANKRPIDWPGFALAAVGVGMLVYALNEGAAAGWSNPRLWAFAAIGVAGIAALIIVELRVNQPMLQLRLLQDRLFRTMMSISALTVAGLLGMLYVFPLLYQDALGASAFASGLTTFPEAIGLMLASQAVSWSYRKVGARVLITAALIAAAIGYGLLCTVTEHTSPWTIRLLLVFCGFCLGHVVNSVQFSIFTNIPQASMGGATALFTVQNRLSSAVGLTLLVCILSALEAGSSGLTGSGSSGLAAYRTALLSAAGLLLAACAFALRIRRADVEPGDAAADEADGYGGAQSFWNKRHSSPS
ncbi:DHA2 family efflux MFS transporter permease subunit [Paenibacillus xylaniclasticus]|uniref:DHA2 family efflux MFS transporter permease subunit n=1 Tax=Paenibacillus xylaniclasticus TaxID=588083 RepID=UPI000FDB0C57|nr:MULTISPECIES: DHA2 family efflux MFS transporter permease subunit [Paenibacillus]